VLKTSGKQALAYFCNALDGSPIAGADVRLWQGRYTGNKYIWKESTKKTNKDGISVFDIGDEEDSISLFVGASINDRQAFSTGYDYSYGEEEASWSIYAFTDRPAYRPNEKMQWKFIARKYDGSVYSTPSDQTVEFSILDPYGTEIKKGKAKLNSFGSAWGSLELTEAMTLGEYQVVFWDEGRETQIGSATLFRLEEYKLPEFKVSVQTPQENGRKKVFRLGEKVEVDVQADYYFGAPVADADVEVILYRKPFQHSWHPPYEFPWLYEGMGAGRQYYGYWEGEEIKREKLKTDATGRATLTFDTDRNAGQDFEYTVEARVTDASRREIEGSGTVRVTRQRYYAYLVPGHNLYRPQDKVTINIKTLDANNEPVAVGGTVKLTRDYWFEVWVDPEGREVKGKQLEAIRREGGIFPPPGERWQLKFQGYRHDDVLQRTVKTDAEGEAEFTFAPEREGYYRITWTGKDKGSLPIKAETTVWVTTDATVELGYRHGGLEIIVDKDTFRVGQKAAVMLNVPTNDRYVLFSVDGEDLYGYRLVHVTGTTKLVELKIEEKHVPNIFISGAMVSDLQLFTDTEEVVVPPVKNFLTVEVESDREEYRPGGNGTLTVTTLDYDGKPIPAEVAIGLIDESVYYIQQDYAEDPKEFFYGTKRSRSVNVGSTFQQNSYVRLVEGKGGKLIDERLKPEERKDGELEDTSGRSEELSGSAGADEFSRNKNSSTLKSLGYIGGDIVEEPVPAAAPMYAQEEKMTGQQPAVRVRSDFRSTVFWGPGIITGKNGKTTVKVKFPDSLTTWKATARAATGGNQFGIATDTMRTKKPLIVRLQAPHTCRRGP
jgi:uncharacterized protein YfaS (alpha-2-macroglobulin family)